MKTKRQKSPSAPNANHRGLSRRMFLKGAGGTALAIPFLSSLAPKHASAAVQGSPKRFIALRSPQGCPPSLWFPADKHPLKQVLPGVHTLNLEDLDVVSRVFGPEFNSVRKKMLMLRRLDPLVNKQGHNGSLTLSHAMGNGVEGLTWETIDQIMARHVYQEEPVRRLLSLKTRKTGGNISYVRQGNEVVEEQAINDAHAAFRALFGDIDGEASQTDQDRKAARQKLVVDRVQAHFQKARNSARISKQDRETLSAHIEHMYKLETGLDALSKRQGCTPPENVAPAPKATDIQTDLIRSMMDIMFAAIKCDLTRIFTFKFHPGNSFLIPGVTRTYHGLAHSNDDEALQQIERIDVYQARHVAYLLNLLDSEVDPESGGTYLDSSIVYYGKEMANAPGHKNYSQPVLLAGSGGGYLKTGLLVDYKTDIPRDGYSEFVGHAYPDFLITLMLAMGLQPKHWEKNGQPGFGEYHDYIGKTHIRLDNIVRGDQRSPLPYIVA